MNAAHEYLSNTWNRDKIMAIAQFLPMMLKDPVQTMGCDELSQSLGGLSKMADSYRAITRLSLLANALSQKTISSIAKGSEDATVEKLTVLSHGIHVLYCINEHTAVLSSHGVLPKSVSRLGGVAVLCWFYTLVLGIIRQTYLLAKHNPNTTVAAPNAPKPYSQKECKKAIVDLIKMSCFTVFALTCLPAGKPQLLADVSGPLAPLHQVIEVISPPHLELSDTVRGALGFVASVCDFY